MQSSPIRVAITDGSTGWRSVDICAQLAAKSRVRSAIPKEQRNEKPRSICSWILIHDSGSAQLFSINACGHRWARKGIAIGVERRADTRQLAGGARLSGVAL